jgi:hypothetical protein
MIERGREDVGTRVDDLISVPWSDSRVWHVLILASVKYPFTRPGTNGILLPTNFISPLERHKYKSIEY